MNERVFMQLATIKNGIFALSVGLASLSGAARAAATTWVVKPNESPATFVATGKPGFLKIRGEGGQVQGTAMIEDGKLQGTFDVTVAAFKTGIDLRDEHMHGKYLESAKFPTARLVISPVAVEESGKAKEYDFTGKLTLKGIEKPVAGKLELQLDGSAAKGKATFVVKLSDYPVGVPSHLGVSVAESVEVQTVVTAEKRTDIAAKP